MRFLSWLLTGSILAAGVTAAEDPLATLRPGHPRLLLAPGTLAAALTAARTDPLREKLHRQVVRAAEIQLKEAPIRYVLVGPRLLDQSRKALAHVTTSAMAYRLTGDGRFADHARDVMLTAAGFPDWNPSHFLDVAEMATALGLGYDWLHERLTPAERATIKRALLDKALAYVRPAYARADPERESFPFVKGNLTNNWNQVCNGGFLIAALALAEDEPEMARAVLAGLRETLPAAMAAYQPDGAYPEGPVYWGYGTRYNVLIFAALESALGHAFGLDQLAGFDRTELFRVHVQSPTGLSFNFADGRAGLGADSALTWLAQRHRQPVAEAHSRQLLAAELERAPNPADRFIATHVVWFPRANTGDATLPLDAVFDGPSKLALFRSAWGDPRALWTGLKAGSNRVNHGHLDLGSFMLDADGERWAVDLGPDGYNLPGYWSGATAESPRWQYYRLNNRSHNTLTPANVLQSPDADGRILAFGSAPGRAFAVADLSSAYPGHGRQFRRGVALLDRARVLVQDEVSGLKPHVALTWRMLTGAEVTLAGRQATLRQNGRTLRVEILEPDNARFTRRPAAPPTAVEEQNAGITELVAEAPAAAGEKTDVRLAVLLTPVGDKWPVQPAPALESLDTWK
ncbi:MAG TPA: heparinase II/III family protein [Lacunisphaera sp.]|nr:heparinase II/III family protein [Lacunisphaera sp.]